jgi:CopG-like RHH_1 or ribbon-helix-helix domain, RHH_5
MPLDVPKRLFATVPDYVADALDQRAKREGRSTSNLVAFLLEQEVSKEQAEKSSELPTEAK